MLRGLLMIIGGWRRGVVVLKLGKNSEHGFLDIVCREAVLCDTKEILFGKYDKAK